MADGSRHELYAVAETTKGETPTNPAFDTIRITGTTLGLTKDSLQSNEIRSDRQIADFRLGSNQVGGDINFELSYGSFDQFLMGVLCSPAWTGTPEAINGGDMRHSWTFVRDFQDLNAGQKPFYVYRGCEMNNLTLTITANAMITGTFTVFGQSQELLSDLSSLGTVTYKLPTTSKPLDSFTGTLEEGGGEIAVVTEISLSLQNAIAARFVVGNKNSIDPSIGRSNLTGSVTAFFEDSTLVEKFINETESKIDLVLPDLEGNVINISIPRFLYTGGQPDVSGEGPITLTMPFQALLDPTTGTNITIERVPNTIP